MDMRSLDPWQEMRRLQGEMEHLFTELTPGWRWPLTSQYPPLNIIRSDNGITVEALCPAVDRQTFDVQVVGDTVTIRGERKPEADISETRYYRRERPTGSFARTLSVGEPLDGERTQATYGNGILRVQLARAPEATPKKIAVKN